MAKVINTPLKQSSIPGTEAPITDEVKNPSEEKTETGEENKPEAKPELTPTEKLKGKRFKFFGNESLLLSVDDSLNLTINGEPAGTCHELRGSLMVRKIVFGIPFTAKIPMAMLYV